MIDLDELKRLARAATPGKWNTEEFTSVVSLRADRGCLIEWLNPSEGDRADARYIAAANPAAVLALIERVERAESDNGALLKWVSGRDCHEVFSGDDCIESNLSRKEMCLRCRVVSDPHPGAALLERIAALESALKEKP